MKTYTIRLDDEDYETIERLAKASGIPMAILMRNCVHLSLPVIEQHYRELPTKFDSLKTHPVSDFIAMNDTPITGHVPAKPPLNSPHTGPSTAEQFVTAALKNATAKVAGKRATRS